MFLPYTLLILTHLSSKFQGMPKEITILSGVFPPDLGGPAKFALEFSHFCVTQSVKTSVISLTNLKSDYQEKNQINVWKVSRALPILIRITKTSWLIRKKLKSDSSLIANGLFLELLIASVGLNRRFVTKVPGDIVWERARTKGATNLSIIDFQKSKLSSGQKIQRWLYSTVLRKSEFVVVPSQELANLCMGWGVDQGKIRYIPNSVDTKMFSSLANEKKYDVISVCRLVPWKGLDEILETAAKLDFSLAIVGTGPDYEKLVRLSHSLGARVDFLGDVEQYRLPGLLSSARYFVLNSTFEATSYALIEAMSCNLVPLANEETGSSEVISHMVDGILLNKSTGLTLKRALVALESDSQLYSQLANAAREKAIRNFNQNVNFLRILHIVQKGDG